MPTPIRYSSPVDGNFGNISKISPIFRYLSVFLPIFLGNFPIFLTSPARTQDTKSVQFFLKKTRRCYLVIWSWFAGQGCVFQPGAKIVDLGFVKFKSNGTKAKRPLEQIQKTQGEKKKRAIFLVFLGGFEIKRGWIFPEIKWGMDFLRNQTGLKKKITWLD